jgi:hypothetical protein
MPGTSDPVYPGLPLRPVVPPPVYARLCAFSFPLIPFWGNGGGLQSLLHMSGGFGCVLSPFYGLP